MSKIPSRCRVCELGTLELVSARVHPPNVVFFGWLWTLLSILLLLALVLPLVGIITGLIRFSPGRSEGLWPILYFAMLSLVAVTCGTLGAFCTATKELLRCSRCFAAIDVCAASRYLPPPDFEARAREQLRRDLEEEIERESLQHSEKST
jgi:hypothetical protein